MCGIFGYVGKQSNAPEIVLDGLKQLEYRGYDSWGIAEVIKDKQKISVKKKAGKIGDAAVHDMPKSTLAFGHTRWATHGGVTDVNAHPHLDCTKQIAVIHNGIVENYKSLKQKLLKKGHIFVSDTDTEIIAHLIEEYMKRYALLPKDTDIALSKATQAAFNNLEGLNAVIIIHAQANELIAVRNGSPLVVGFGNGENFLSSDPAALLSHTKQVHFLEDDQMAIVKNNNIHIFDTRSGEPIAPRKQILTWTATDAEKGNFPYFMLKEIYDQPGMLSEIASETSNQASELAIKLNKSPHIYIAGSGTSGNAARAASYFFATIANRLTNWSTPTEMHHHLHILKKRSVLLTLSQSGETMDLIEVVTYAKKHGISVLSLVNVIGSSLWRMSDMKLPIGAGPEKAVASTKAFTATIAQLILISYAMAHDIKAGQLLVASAAKSAQKILTKDTISKMQHIAALLKTHEHVFVIGRGISYSTALESALKIKEISYIQAEAIPAGELKHGPLALISHGTPCIVFAPNDDQYTSTINNAIELKSRGGYVIGISYTHNEVFDEYIPVHDVGVATIIPNVIVAQLLAYYLTLERGYNPDMPRNLAKSVTVK